MVEQKDDPKNKPVVETRVSIPKHKLKHLKSLNLPPERLPEEYLMSAVLGRAIFDISGSGNWDRDREVDRNTVMETFEWFESNDRSDLYSFKNITDCLTFSKDKLDRIYAIVKEAKIKYFKKGRQRWYKKEED